MDLMESEHPLAPNFDGLIEAERKNFEATTTTLGTTIELVQDFQGLYQSLADFIRISSADGMTPEQAKVGGYVLHLLMKCRSDLLVGCLNLLTWLPG
jgi:hypothetical protein